MLVYTDFSCPFFRVAADIAGAIQTERQRVAARLLESNKDFRTMEISLWDADPTAQSRPSGVPVDGRRATDLAAELIRQGYIVYPV